MATRIVLEKQVQENRSQTGWHPTYDNDLTDDQPNVVNTHAPETPPPWVAPEPTASLVIEDVVQSQEEQGKDPAPMQPEPSPSLHKETAGANEFVSATTSVVINEIMYYPESDLDQEVLGHEYVELFNPTDKTIALQGYHFTKGIQFAFPAVSIASQGYLVVAADQSGFRDAYGGEAEVVGPWKGKLSNSGEELRLEDAEGLLVDRVAYADQGDWALRERSQGGGLSRRARWQGGGSRSFRRSISAGWVWESSADGEGSSLELINPNVSNNLGTNWLPSKRQDGSPGRRNTVFASETAPLIAEVRHHPPVPKPNHPVVIVASIEDERPGDITATVRWRESGSNRGDESFQSAPMQHTGKGRYRANLPGHRNRTIIEFYVEASDGRSKRTWPAATNIGQASNALYQVDKEVNRTVMGYYRLIMTEQEMDQFESLYAHSNAQMNTTLIADDGSGPIIRYQCGTRVRGAGSRNNRPRPMRVNIPRDKPWENRYRMNLNSVYTWLQFIGMKLFQASDLPAPETMAVQVRLNGEKNTRNSSSDYGAFVHVQPLDGQFIKAYFPNDPGGNLYKKVRPDNSWRWHSGDVSAYRDDGWLKQTNSAASNWNDLDRFLGVMNNASRKSDYIEQVERVMNIDQWLRYLAVMALLNNNEGGIGNGIDDDYAMYRGINDQRFQALPHDLDTILGVGESSSNPRHTLFDFVENGSRLDPLVPLLDHPDIRKRYFLQISDLIRTSFSEQRFESLLDQNLSGWVASSRVQQIKDFMMMRRHYAAQQVARALGKSPSEVAAPTAATKWRAPKTGRVMIHEVLAANGSVHEHRGGYPDMIELYNPGSDLVSLAGLSLSDDPAKPGQFIFPVGAELAAGGYLLLYADNQHVENEWHVGFGLKQEGETLTLFDQADATGKRVVLDQVSFGPQIPGLSIGRGGNELAVWALTMPTLGAANESMPVATPGAVRINEWLACPKAHYGTDFIELINPTPTPVALAGTSLTSDSINAPQEMVFPPLSYIGAKDLLLLESLGKKRSQRHPCDLTFRLASHSGWITFSGANRRVIDKVHYWGQRPDISQGRLPDASAGIAIHRTPSPGHPNGSANSGLAETGGMHSLIAGLRISEIMYHPVNPKLEFLELTNIGQTVLNLKGVRFTGGVKAVLPNISLAPQVCVVLVKNRKAFEAKYGKENVRIAAEYEGKLSNGGEYIQLTLPSPSNLNILRFDYNDSWVASTDGEGHSLIVTKLQALVEDWGMPTQWQASPKKGGNPGSL